MSKVVVYQRVSTSSQDLERQRAQEERARADYPDRTPFVIPDDGVSAFKVPIFERRGGRELVRLIEAGRVEALYVDAQDRLSRGKLAEWVNFKALCDDNGVRIIIDGRELDADDEADELMSVFGAITARRESKEKAHRSRGSARLRAERGRFHGGAVPLGYDLGEEGGLVVNEAEAAVVRRVFERTLAGDSQRKVARDLQADGIRTKRGGEWSQAIVRRILGNPTYKGVRVMDDEEYRAEFPALVDPETWEQARRLREALRRLPSKGLGPVPISKHLFRGGLLRCGRCGEAMVPRTIRPRSKTGKWGEWYLCHRRVRLGPGGCSQTPAQRLAVDTAVLDFFAEIALDVESTRAHIEEQSNRLVTEARAMKKQAEREVMRCQQATARIRGYVGEGRLGPEELEIAKHDEVAAQAELERLAEQERMAEEMPKLADADELLLAQVMRVREAVTGRIQDAGSIEAVRAALLSIFGSFVYRQAESPGFVFEELGLGGCWLEPRFQPGVVDEDELAEAMEEGGVWSINPAPLHVPTNDNDGRPFVYDELVARMRAVLRRSSGPRHARLTVRDLEIDLAARLVTVAGEPVQLSAKEYELLVALAEDPERVFKKEDLLRDVWGFRSLGRTRTLDSHASRLRRKLNRNGDAGYVLNVWGVGYRLTAVS